MFHGPLDCVSWLLCLSRRYKVFQANILMICAFVFLFISTALMISAFNSSEKQFLILKWKPSFLRLCSDNVDLQTVIHTRTVGLVKRTDCGSRCSHTCVCLCLSINDQLTSSKATHSKHSHCLTFKPSLGLSLRIALSFSPSLR